MFPIPISYIYENIDDYNPSTKRTILIVFGEMIADMTNKKIQVIIKKLLYAEN